MIDTPTPLEWYRDERRKLFEEENHTGTIDHGRNYRLVVAAIARTVWPGALAYDLEGLIAKVGEIKARAPEDDEE